jgi:hypothetical protein
MKGAEKIGEFVGIGAILALVIWAIWAIWKYKPFSHFVKVLYDMRYFVLNVVLMYSSRPSIFSIKRFHSGLILYWAVITASMFIRKRPMMDAEGLMIIMLPLLALGGYNVYQSQQDKKMKAGIQEEPKEDEPKVG